MWFWVGLFQEVLSVVGYNKLIFKTYFLKLIAIIVTLEGGGGGG